MNKWVLVFFLFAFVVSVRAQTPKYPVANLPVTRNGAQLTNPLTGGINAPQFSPIDLNGDGIDDLFVFDRGGDKVLTFLNDGSHTDTAFHYAPQYEQLFPSLHVWALIRDYNHDGVPDIFTNQIGETAPGGQQVPVGIKVYKGSRVNGNLHFEVVQYCLYYSNSGNLQSLWTNGLGVPAIVDVNHDGDLDVLAFDVYGTTVQYFENQTVETSANADSLPFALANTCWGNFYVSNSNAGILLNVSCKGGAVDQGNGGPRHTGAALSAVDYEHDGDVDLFISGAHINYTQLLVNTGSANGANIGWVDTLWPQCSQPVRLPLFPGLYEVDGDNDGEKDLLVAPIVPSPAVDVNNVMFYRYTTGDTCSYQFSGNDSFLVHTSIDLGTDSKPVFFDFNGDGLMDIVVGNYYRYNPVVAGVSTLTLYQNTGTATQPKFTQVTNDYAGLSTYSSASGLLAFNPAFGDLDGDNKPDMLVGASDGNLYFFKNSGGATASFPSLTTNQYFNLNVGTYAAPFIYDLNGDSLPDLVIGRADGGISYYWNFGTRASPLFSVDSVNLLLGNVSVAPLTSNLGYSQPYIMKDSLNRTLLFVGCADGTVFEYLVNTDSLKQGSFTKLDSDYLKYDAGMKSTFAAYDLNGDGHMDYLLGNSLGGIQLYTELPWDSSAVLNIKPIAEGSISIYPNPANTVFKCVITNGVADEMHVEVFDVIGQKLNVPNIKASNTVTFSSANMNSGLYFIRIYNDLQSFTGKVLVNH